MIWDVQLSRIAVCLNLISPAIFILPCYQSPFLYPNSSSIFQPRYSLESGIPIAEYLIVHWYRERMLSIPLLACPKSTISKTANLPAMEIPRTPLSWLVGLIGYIPAGDSPFTVNGSLNVVYWLCRPESFINVMPFKGNLILYLLELTVDPFASKIKEEILV